MEEILVVILQVFFEFMIELLIYAGLDFTAWSIGKAEEPGSVGCGAMVVFLLLGAGFAALANALHPRPILAYEWLRIANLLLGPPLAGAVSWLCADWRRRAGAKIEPSLHFFFALCFVLGFDLIRFIYAQRDAIR